MLGLQHVRERHHCGRADSTSKFEDRAGAIPINLTCHLTNVKISFSVNCDFNDVSSDTVLDYFTKNVRVIKNGFFTYTILQIGRVNATGIRCICQLNQVIDQFCDFSNIEKRQITDFKIDNISIKISVPHGLKSQLIASMTYTSRFFEVRNPPKFCGLILRNGGISISVFNGVSAIASGFKNITQIDEKLQMFGDFLTSLQECPPQIF